MTLTAEHRPPVALVDRRAGLTVEVIPHAARPVILPPGRGPVPCPTCRRGCDCEGGIPGLGCGHHGCWGREASNDCPGIGYEAARAEVLGHHAYRLDRARKHGTGSYRRELARLLAAAGLTPVVGGPR